jgi:thiol-disulfide isomerase/thioredoxin
MQKRSTNGWTKKSRRAARVAAAGLTLYGMALSADNAVPSARAQSQPASAPLPAGPGRNDLAKGDMATFVFKPAPDEPADVKFLGGDGKERSLAGFKGKVVLVNLWATWCAPCLKEMPGLDRLQKEFGSDQFEVVALAVDRTGLEGAKKFLDKIKTANLALYADPTARAGTALKAVGMPTTILVGKDGREIGRLSGPAEWDGPDAKKLIEAVLKRS